MRHLFCPALGIFFTFYFILKVHFLFHLHHYSIQHNPDYGNNNEGVVHNNSPGGSALRHKLDLANFILQKGKLNQNQDGDEVNVKEAAKKHGWKGNSVENFVKPVIIDKNEKEKESFYDALIRTKDIEDVYRKVNGEIDIIDGNLFRSYIEIPNTVPVGQYKVNLYLIIDNKISNEYSYNFMVTRVGIEEAIYSFSKNYPLIYGLISLLIAILIGWSGAEVFKRFRKV